MDLPKVDEIIRLNDTTFRLYIIAIDLDEGIWTCVEEITGELKIYNFDENGNFGLLAPNLEDMFISSKTDGDYNA